MLIVEQTENTKRTDQFQKFDYYGKQEADAREKQDIADFEKSIINQHYTGLGKISNSFFTIILPSLLMLLVFLFVCTCSNVINHYYQGLLFQRKLLYLVMAVKS